MAYINLNMISKLESKLKIVLILAGIFTLISLLHFILNYQNTFDYIFGDRDLLRAKNLLNNFQISGSEMNYAYGSRVPGGFLYYYLFILINIFKSPELIYLGNFILIFLSIIFFFISITKLYNFRVGIVAILFLVTPPDMSVQLVVNWNPTFGFGLYLLGVSCFINFIIYQKKKWLIFSLIITSLTMQIHFSFAAFLFFIFLENLFAKRVKNIFLLTATIFILIIAYSPSIFYFIFLDSLSPVENFFIFFNENEQVNSISYQHYIRTIFKFFIDISSANNWKININFLFPIIQIIIGIWCYLILKKNKNKKLYNFIYIAILNISVFLIATIIIALKGNNCCLGVTGRYMLFYLPLYSLFIGFAYNILIEHFLLKKNYYILLGLILFIFLKLSLFNFLIFKKYYYKNEDMYISYKVKNKFLHNINKEYNTDSNFLLNNLSFAIEKKEKIDFLPLPIQYQIETFKFKFDPQKNILNNCIFILIGANNSSKNISANYLNKKFSKPTYIKKILNKNDNNEFTIITYKTQNGVCYSNVRNPYIPSKNEEESLSLLYTKKINDVIFIKKGTYKYYLNINDALNKPIDLSLEIYKEPKNNAIKSSIVSKRLRNHITILNGFWEKTSIEKPQLVFENNVGKILKFDYYNEILGDVITTPLTINLDGILWDKIDTYNIYFTYMLEGKKINIKLN